ncbi:MAG: acetyltransferase, partial [Terriglobia bacterium]
RRYVPNNYGRTSSPLHGGLPTDRLVAEWWLRTPRVQAAVRGGSLPHHPAGPCIRVPAAIEQFKKTDRAAAQKVQTEVREQFEKWLGQGYAVTGFLLDEEGGTYLLEPFQGSR